MCSLMAPESVERAMEGASLGSVAQKRPRNEREYVIDQRLSIQKLFGIGQITDIQVAAAS